MAVLTLVLNIKVVFGGESYFFRFAMFNMVNDGGIMGYLGNLLSMLLVVIGFGSMFIFGLYALNGGGMKAVRPSLVAGALMSLLAVISLFCSISSGKFNFFGDIIILAMPVVYTLCMFSAISCKKWLSESDFRQPFVLFSRGGILRGIYTVI